MVARTRAFRLRSCRGAGERERMRFIRSNRSNRPVAAIVLVAALILALPTVASAQTLDPTDGQYGPDVLGEVAQGGPSSGGGGSGNAAGTTDVGSISELPFTGLDLVAIAAIGVGLLGAGFVIRRTAGKPDELG